MRFNLLLFILSLSLWLLTSSKAQSQVDVVISWDPVPEFNELALYRVYQLTGTNLVKFDVQPPTTTSERVKTIILNAPLGTSLYYITAVNKVGLESLSSAVVTNVISASVPSSVTGLSGTALVVNGELNVSLKWNANPSSDLVTGYQIRRFDEVGVEVGTPVIVTTLNYSVTIPPQPTRFEVRARNVNGVSVGRSFEITRLRAPGNPRVDTVVK